MNCFSVLLLFFFVLIVCFCPSYPHTICDVYVRNRHENILLLLQAISKRKKRGFFLLCAFKTLSRCLTGCINGVGKHFSRLILIPKSSQTLKNTSPVTSLRLYAVDIEVSWQNNNLKNHKDTRSSNVIEK